MFAIVPIYVPLVNKGYPGYIQASLSKIQGHFKDF